MTLKETLDKYNAESRVQSDVLATILQITWEDPALTFWEKGKFTVWLFYVTSPIAKIRF